MENRQTDKVVRELATTVMPVQGRMILQNVKTNLRIMQLYHSPVPLYG